MYDYQLLRSIRHSSIRKRVLSFLYSIKPSGSYVSNIAYDIHATPSNVLGAIRGMKSRYDVNDSLLNLNLVELCSVYRNVKFYRITDLGVVFMDRFRSVL